MILPRARDCSDMAAANTHSNAYFNLALGNIATALATPGTYTCTLTTSGKDGDAVQAVRNALTALGFVLTQTTTTITISWATA